MITILIYLIFCFPQQDQVPLLAAEEFSYEMEYFLKQKESKSSSVYDISDESRSSTGSLPFVRIKFSLLSFLDSDKKIRVYQGSKMLNNYKIKGPMKLNLDMGFSEDLKEGLVPSIFHIYIINDNKTRRTQIKVEVKPNGELLINEVVSGMI